MTWKIGKLQSQFLKMINKKSTKKLNNGDLFELKCLGADEINKDYIYPLKKSKFIHYKRYTVEDQKKYVNEIIQSNNKMIMGFYKNKKLIGSSTIHIHKDKCNFGVYIFSMNERGKGFTNILIQMILKFSHKELNVKSFFAGSQIINFKSTKSFLKNNFRIYRYQNKSLILKRQI